ncbi:MAG: LysR family transcriptional regulator [Acidobacteriota bacterium]|nr:LysR family transcriptional regulator [Acidobacteriota bacterium]
MTSPKPVAPAYRSTPLDVRRLNLFLAVVDHGGFSKAAAAVHLSQPALSQAIAELEAELGGPLFHRLSRSVTLTDVGQSLLGPARSVMRAIDQARQVTGEVTGLARGRLELSALRTLSADPLPALLGRFVAAHPKIEVHLAAPDDPAQLVEQVRSGAVEMGLTAAGPVPAGLVAVPLGSQHLQDVFPPDHPAVAKVVTPAELAGVGFIVTPRGSSGRDLLEGWMGAAGVELSVAVETTQREALLPLVLAGAGIALLPAGTARMAAANGAVVADLEPALVRDLFLVHRPGLLTPAASAFLAVAATRPEPGPA